MKHGIRWNRLPCFSRWIWKSLEVQSLCQSYLTSLESGKSLDCTAPHQAVLTYKDCRDWLKRPHKYLLP